MELKAGLGLELMSSHSQSGVFLITQSYVPLNSNFILWQKDRIHKSGERNEMYLGFSKVVPITHKALINEGRKQRLNLITETHNVTKF